MISVLNVHERLLRCPASFSSPLAKKPPSHILPQLRLHLKQKSVQKKFFPLLLPHLISRHGKKDQALRCVLLIAAICPKAALSNSLMATCYFMWIFLLSSAGFQFRASLFPGPGLYPGVRAVSRLQQLTGSRFVRHSWVNSPFQHILLFTCSAC